MNILNLSSIFIIFIGASVIGRFARAKISKNSVREPRFISFDSEGGKIDIDLDLSVPFLSIPLDNEVGPGEIRGPLLNVNTKAITVAGLMAAIAAFIVPLFFNKTPSGHHYRLDDNLGMWQMGNTVNDLFLGNNYATPCVQRAFCTLVSRVAKTNNPTSSDKIIDGITSNRWFENVTNGTTIQEAIATGRENGDCSFIYKGCSIPGHIFDNLLDQFGDL